MSNEITARVIKIVAEQLGVPEAEIKNESAFVAVVAVKIVFLLGISMDEVNDTTSRNAIELFQLQNFIHLNHD